MKILKIEFQNFKSYGNKKNVLNFEKDFINDLILLSGKNGSGKSTLKEVIEFSLYGKVDGFKLNDLPNRTNRNLYTYIKFESRGKIVEIERGILPSVFKLTIDGKEYDQAGKRNIQQYVETELFDIPYHVFKNILVLSINNFKSFLTMSPKDKRDIIDKIFGFDVINKMNEEIKTDKKSVEQSHIMKKYEIDSIEQSIVLLENKIVAIKTENKEKDSEELEKLKNKLEEKEEELKEVIKGEEKLNKDLKSLATKYEKYNTNITRNKQKLINLNDKYKLYENDQCPECGSSLKTDEHQKHKDDLKSNLLKLKDLIIKDKDKADKHATVVNKKQNETRIITQKRYDVEHSITSIKREIINLSSKDSVDDKDTKGLKEMLETYEKDLKAKKEEIQVIDKQKMFFDNIKKILGEDGVKQVIFKNVIPLLNSNIREVLKNMDTNFNVSINDSFDCSVTSFGSEINVSTLSTGERVRIDLAIVISLIKIIKLQYPTLNILFLDEIFSNIDLESIDNIIELIKSISKDLSINTILISHSPVTELLFDKKITLVKRNTFSNLEINSM